MAVRIRGSASCKAYNLLEGGRFIAAREVGKNLCSIIELIDKSDLRINRIVREIPYHRSGRIRIR